MSENNKPVFKVKVGTIDCAVWKQAGEKGDFLTVTAKRNYKDKEGNWKTTDTLRINDIPAMNLALEEAFKYAKLKSETKENDEN